MRRSWRRSRSRSIRPRRNIDCDLAAGPATKKQRRCYRRRETGSTTTATAPSTQAHSPRHKPAVHGVRVKFLSAENNWTLIRRSGSFSGGSRTCRTSMHKALREIDAYPGRRPTTFRRWRVLMGTTKTVVPSPTGTFGFVLAPAKYSLPTPSSACRNTESHAVLVRVPLPAAYADRLLLSSARAP